MGRSHQLKVWVPQWEHQLDVRELCYIQILKESRCGQERRVKGREHIWLIAIDYHTATGTARMEHRRLKVKDDQTARVWNRLWWPYKRHKGEGDSEVEQEGQIKVMWVLRIQSTGRRS